MALTVFTLQDTEEGGIDFRFSSEPGIPSEGENLTTAQVLALLCLRTIRDASEEAVPDLPPDEEEQS